MDRSSISQLEMTVERLLSSYEQLRGQCERLLDEKRQWHKQRSDLLREVESVLADLETLRAEP